MYLGYITVYELLDTKLSSKYLNPFTLIYLKNNFCRKIV